MTSGRDTCKFDGCCEDGRSLKHVTQVLDMRCREDINIADPDMGVLIFCTC